MCVDSGDREELPGTSKLAFGVAGQGVWGMHLGGEGWLPFVDHLTLKLLSSPRAGSAAGGTWMASKGTLPLFSPRVHLARWRRDALPPQRLLLE